MIRGAKRGFTQKQPVGFPLVPKILDSKYSATWRIGRKHHLELLG